jgi:hypothetical protein
MCYILKVFTSRTQAFATKQGFFIGNGIAVKVGVPEYENEIGEGDSHNRSIH